MTPRDEATERQIQAARPDTSTWLAANAGSGKTRVLTDRVARLLLDGVQPQHILCLTYTKAAASEMQNRLFQRLGRWAMLGNASLAEELEKLGVDSHHDPERMARARTLFARAIETPGGLKIQTIHSFCAALLRRFPLEAGVSPQFTEMEDRAAALLRNEIVEDLADGPEAGAVEAVARHVTATGFDDLTKEIARHRDAFGDIPGWAALLRRFGLPDGFDEASLESRVFDGCEADLLMRLGKALAGGKSSDVKAANSLSQIGTPTLGDLPQLENVFLYGSGAKMPFSAKLGTFPTKDTRSSHLDLMPALEAFMQRVEQARPLRLALAAAWKTQALHDFAQVFLPEYARRKQLHGWLDFDDLIQKAQRLLSEPSVAAWVLYRLDGGIDHILVDEAQDTSPAQWTVIEKLAQEFTSGLGARPEVRRTIFVVGDKKQSIYSFQGADPGAFDRMQTEFGERLAGAGNRLEDLTLEFSFRSSEAILRLVDLVFEGQTAAGFREEGLHRAFKPDLPGRVDLWPVVEKTDDKDDRVWTDPVDRPGPRHHTVILAERIAATIKRMIEDGETVPTDEFSAPSLHRRRQVRAGDFLILVQRRSDLFAEIIRACKAADLPIAGADRLKVGAEIAVRDLAALLSFLATPEDDLALATALKSPLFGWTEKDLFDLAHRRETRYLWQALRDRGTEFPETSAALSDLRDHTDFLRPYDLIERILTRHDGRRRLLGRLGPEAEDGINALLSQALAYERSDIPSLTGFLVWLETDDLEIKRQMGSTGNMVRVMTVHGAKGLEAPIVILPDTGARRPSPDDEILVDGDLPVWRVNSDQMPDAMKAAREDARGREANERLRLLYVALTRAEKWLIVAAAGELDKDGNSWYQMVETAMHRSGATGFDFAGGSGLRLSHGDWEGSEIAPDTVAPEPAVALPAFFHHPAPVREPTRETISPSDLGGAKALAGEEGLDEEAAKLRGARIHRLLEYLPDTPENHWNEVSARLLADTPAAELASLVDEARRVLTDPALATLFSADALAEVSLSCDFGNARLHGVVDRLIVTEHRVKAIDFKTNAVVPETVAACPERLLRQMGAYAHALGKIYPDRRIETAILWTRNARLMPLPHDLVTQALMRAARLDDAGPAS